MAKRKGYQYVGGDMWVAPDGSYGQGQVLLIDTTLWDDSDFDELDMASDSQKQYVAEKIQKERVKQYRKMKKLLKDSDSISIRVFRIDKDGVEELNNEDENRG